MKVKISTLDNNLHNLNSIGKFSVIFILSLEKRLTHDPIMIANRMQFLCDLLPLNAAHVE